MSESIIKDDSIVFKKGHAALFIGLDVSDDSILREGTLNDLSVSPILDRSKLCRAFKLTPVLEVCRKDVTNASDSKEDKLFDLSTPVQGVTVNSGSSCPERPVKNLKCILPVTERSCRPLFTEESLHSTAHNSKFEKGNLDKFNKSSSKKYGGKVKENLEDVFAACGDKKLDETCDSFGEEDCDSNLSCTSTSSCTKSRCDVTSCSSSACLSSPDLSIIKGTKRTIESSTSDIEALVIEDDDNSHASVFEDQEVNLLNLNGGDLVSGPSLSQNLQICEDASNELRNSVPLSAEGTPHNWTLVSGVSPLPSTDPSHLRQFSVHRLHHHLHNHHHHHHHNHHHHHHHRHRHHHLNHQGKKGTKAPPANIKFLETSHVYQPILTSTPIRLKAGAKLDMSSIKTNSLDEVVGDFVITSDLEASELRSSGLNAHEKINARSSSTFSNTKNKHLDILPHNSDDLKRMLAVTDCSVDEPSDKVLKSSSATSQPNNYEKLFAGRTPFTRRLTKDEVRLLSSTPENFSDDIWHKLSSPLGSLSSEI